MVAYYNERMLLQMLCQIDQHLLANQNPEFSHLLSYSQLSCQIDVL